MPLIAELKLLRVKQNIMLALLMAIVLKLFLPEFVKLMG